MGKSSKNRIHWIRFFVVGSAITAAVHQSYVITNLPLLAMAVTAVFPMVGTAVIAYGIKVTIGLRPTVEVERNGLDQSHHGEHGYIFDSSSI